MKLPPSLGVATSKISGLCPGAGVDVSVWSIHLSVTKNYFIRLMFILVSESLSGASGHFFFREYLNRHVIHRDLDWRILVRSDSQRRSSRLLRNFKYEENNVLTNKRHKAGRIKAAWKADCSFCVAWTQDGSGLFEGLSFVRFGKRIVFRYYVCVCVYVYVYVIYQTRNTVFDHISKHREESYTTRSGVFLTNFEVFGNVVKHGVLCLIYLLNRD